MPTTLKTERLLLHARGSTCTFCKYHSFFLNETFYGKVIGRSDSVEFPSVTVSRSDVSGFLPVEQVTANIM
jgi:hypothetical protein